jgi:hypothetical protein
MYKINIIFLLIPIFIVVSCHNDNLNNAIGSDIVPAISNVIYNDSFSIAAYTVKADSIPTSGFLTAMVGLYQPKNQYFDNFIGSDTVSSYFTVSQPATLPLLNSGARNITGAPFAAIFDSAVLVLRSSHYFYGDTTLPFTLIVHHVSLPMNFAINPRNNGIRYNTSNITSQDKNSPVIGIKTFLPRPSYNYNIFVRLDNKFGRDLFNKVDSDNVMFSTTGGFNDYIGSFFLTPGNQPSAVLGFVESDKDTSSLVIRIYYHGNAPLPGGVPSAILVGTSFDFKCITSANNPSGLGNLQFNRFIPNPAYPLNNLQYQNNKVSSNLTQQLSYVQSSTGFMTRLEFPTLLSVLASTQNIKLLSATLYLVPNNQVANIFNLPSTISIYQTDNVNDIGALLTNATLTINPVQNGQSAPFYYTAVITTFVNSMLNPSSTTLANPVPAILVTPTYSPITSYLGTSSLGNSNLDRVIINNSKNGSNQNGIHVTGIAITYWLY